MSFNIDKGVPLPEANSMYPFAEMQVGDSFLLPLGDDLDVRRNSVAIAANKYQRAHTGIKFSTRKVQDGVRIWRIA